MATDSNQLSARTKLEPLSPGPECAVLTSIGTVYLYRLGREEMQAWRALPAAQPAADKFRVILGRVASTSISAQGIRETGGLRDEQVALLGDDDIERMAEVYLEAPSLRWQQREATSASPALVREAREPATRFIDRLIQASNGSRSGQWTRAAQAAQAAQATQAAQTAKAAQAASSPRFPALPRPVRDSWIAFGALVLVATLAAAVFVQDYLVVNAMRREQESLAAQARQTQALLAAQAQRMTEENAALRRRIDALEAKLRTPPPTPQPPAQPPARAAKPKPARVKTTSPNRKPGRTLFSVRKTETNGK